MQLYDPHFKFDFFPPQHFFISNMRKGTVKLFLPSFYIVLLLSFFLKTFYFFITVYFSKPFKKLFFLLILLFLNLFFHFSGLRANFYLRSFGYLLHNFFNSLQMLRFLSHQPVFSPFFVNISAFMAKAFQLDYFYRLVRISETIFFPYRGSHPFFRKFFFIVPSLRLNKQENESFDHLGFDQRRFFSLQLLLNCKKITLFFQRDSFFPKAALSA